MHAGLPRDRLRRADATGPRPDDVRRAQRPPRLCRVGTPLRDRLHPGPRACRVRASRGPRPGGGMTAGPSRRLWIGTFPAAGQGTIEGVGEGIWRVDLDVRTGELSGLSQEAVTPAPSFVVVDD